MKRYIAVVVLAAVLATLLASTALAAGPVVGRWAQQTAPQQGAPTTGACPMGGQGGMMGRPSWAGQPDEVEALLGMTDEQIQAARQAGQSLAQLAQSKGVSEDKLIDTILTSKKAAMAEAVAAGTLTQAQADLMIARMTSMVKTMITRTTTGPMGGQGGMMGRGMMGGRGGMRGQGMFGQGLGQSY